MINRYPNRINETGTYASGTPAVVTLSGTAAPGYRSFAEAVLASRLLDGDVVGVLVSVVGNASRWIVAQGTYAATAGTITLTTVEDASATGPVTGSSVNVSVIVTDGMLQALDPDYVPIVVTPPDTDGPDYWEIATTTADTTWSAADGWYVHQGPYLEIGNSTMDLEPTTTGAEAGWETDYRPTGASVDVYVPVGASLDVEYLQLRIYDTSTYRCSINLGSGYTEGAWNTMTGTFDDALTSDLVRARVYAIPSVTGGEPYRLRHLRFIEE